MHVCVHVVCSFIHRGSVVYCFFYDSSLLLMNYADEVAYFSWKIVCKRSTLLVKSSKFVCILMSVIIIVISNIIQSVFDIACFHFVISCTHIPHVQPCTLAALCDFLYSNFSRSMNIFALII